MSEQVITSESSSRLRSFFDRLERLFEDRDAVSNDIKEVFAEAKAEGFQTPIMRKILRLRKISKAARQEEEALIDLYLLTLGEL